MNEPPVDEDRVGRGVVGNYEALVTVNTAGLDLLVVVHYIREGHKWGGFGEVINGSRTNEHSKGRARVDPTAKDDCSVNLGQSS